MIDWFLLFIINFIVGEIVSLRTASSKNLCVYVKSWCRDPLIHLRNALCLQSRSNTISKTTKLGQTYTFHTLRLVRVVNCWWNINTVLENWPIVLLKAVTWGFLCLKEVCIMCGRYPCILSMSSVSWVTLSLYILPFVVSETGLLG